MENDLISRKEVIATIKAQMPKNPMRSTLVHMINVMGKAYDIDKVVEQIREYFGTFLNKSIVDDICNIVKGGGVK